MDIVRQQFLQPRVHDIKQDGDYVTVNDEKLHISEFRDLLAEKKPDSEEWLTAKCIFDAKLTKHTLGHIKKISSIDLHLNYRDFLGKALALTNTQGEQITFHFSEELFDYQILRVIRDARRLLFKIPAVYIVMPVWQFSFVKYVRLWNNSEPSIVQKVKDTLQDGNNNRVEYFKRYGDMRVKIQ